MIDSLPDFYLNAVRQALSILSSCPIQVLPPERRPSVHAGCHFHDCSEINVFLKGRCTLHTSGTRRQFFKAGDMCIIPPFCAHVAEPEDGAEFLAIVNESEGVSLYSPFGERGHLSFLYDSLVITAESIDLNRYLCDCAKLLDESVDSQAQPRQLLQFYLNRLEYMLGSPERVAHNPNIATHPKIQNCLKLLDANISHQDLSVKMLAEHLEMNADYLSALFSECMKTSLGQYIRSQRISLAQKLLNNTQLTMKEVAWNCGFSDASYFTKVFREHTGYTPKAFSRGF